MNRTYVSLPAITALAIALGIISAKYMAQGNPLVTIPWGIAAVGVGLWAHPRRHALLGGSLLGFTASYAYLWADNTSGKTIALALIILIPASFGSLCALLIAWGAWQIKQRIRQ